MLRSLTGFGTALAVAVGLSVAVEAQTPVPNQNRGQAPGQGQAQFDRDLQTGRIIRVDPTRNTIWLRTGQGETAQERQFRLDQATRYFGPDRRPVQDGLRFQGFRQGADVRYRTGAGANAGISELYVAPPAGGTGFGQAQAQAELEQNMLTGRIMRIDPAGNMIWLRSGEGANAREQQFRLSDTTRYFGPDRRPVQDGLRFQGFRQGADVRYRTGAGANAGISELYVAPPTGGSSLGGSGSTGTGGTGSNATGLGTGGLGGTGSGAAGGSGAGGSGGAGGGR